MSQFNYGGLYTATGRFLQRELRRRHMSQQAFADLQFVDVKTVSRWIHGEVHSLDVVVAIADFFGVSVGDVLSDEDGRPFLYKKIKRFRADILCPFGISFYVLVLCYSSKIPLNKAKNQSGHFVSSKQSKDYDTIIIVKDVP